MKTTLLSRIAMAILPFAALEAHLLSQEYIAKGGKGGLPSVIDVSADSLSIDLKLGQGVEVDDNMLPQRPCGMVVGVESGNRVTPGRMTWNCDDVQTRSALLERSGLALSARQGFFFGKVSANVGVINSLATSASNRALVLSVTTEGDRQNCVLEGEPPELDKYKDRIDDYRRIYGNYYVASVEYGPQLVLIAQTNSSSSEFKERFSASLSASWPRGAVTFDHEKVHAGMRSFASVNFRLLMNGYRSEPSQAITLDAALGRFSTFESDIKDWANMKPVKYTLVYFGDRYDPGRSGGAGQTLSNAAYELHAEIQDLICSINTADSEVQERLKLELVPVCRMIGGGEVDATQQIVDLCSRLEQLGIVLARAAVSGSDEAKAYRGILLRDLEVESESVLPSKLIDLRLALLRIRNIANSAAAESYQSPTYEGPFARLLIALVVQTAYHPSGSLASRVGIEALQGVQTQSAVSPFAGDLRQILMDCVVECGNRVDRPDLLNMLMGFTVRLPNGANGRLGDLRNYSARGTTPLHVAAQSGSINVLKALVETYGWDPCVSDQNGDNAFSALRKRYPSGPGASDAESFLSSWQYVERICAKCR